MQPYTQLTSVQIYTAKMRKELDAEEDRFRKYCERFPAKERTVRGEPFWHRHAAKNLLADDVESGLAYELKPELLRLTRAEYQEFTLHTFRKHIHQEKEKQRAAPYWRHKRNIAALIQLVKDREVHKQEWMDKRAQVDIDKAESSFGRLNL
jgi:hypothetical protein